MTMIPCVPYFGPSRWLEFGPFAVQARRVPLYAAYFFIGAGIGAANFGKGLLSPEGRLANSGWGWTVAAFIPYCLLWALIYIKREILGNPDVLPDWYEASYGIFFAAFSAAILFAILAYFLQFKQAGWSVLDPIQRDAYGIFLVHYAFALWVQYWLFEFDLTAITKVLMGFTFTLAASWMLTALLRKVPGASRVL
jgi:surface polysaccharide O-acyltransferase-like enzyme